MRTPSRRYDSGPRRVHPLLPRRPRKYNEYANFNNNDDDGGGGGGGGTCYAVPVVNLAVAKMQKNEEERNTSTTKCRATLLY